MIMRVSALFMQSNVTKVLSFWALFFCLSTPVGQPANAADVGVFSFDPQSEFVGIPFTELSDKNYGQPFILLKGEITSGDFERVQSAARDLANNGYEIVLALESPGGSVVEALKIADFVREHWITTWIYGRSSRVGDPDRSVIVCDSACAYIFFAGIERRYQGSNMMDYAPDDPYLIAPENQVSKDFAAAAVGAILGTPVDPRSLDRTEAIPPLGLHRPYLDPGLNKTLSAVDARQAYIELEGLVREKMSEYGVPATLVDRMMKANSNQIVRISSDKLRELMPTYDPWFEEWQLSKCGALDSSEILDLSRMKFPLSGAQETVADFSVSYRNFLMGKESSIKACERNLRLGRQVQILE